MVYSMSLGVPGNRNYYLWSKSAYVFCTFQEGAILLIMNTAPKGQERVLVLYLQIYLGVAVPPQTTYQIKGRCATETEYSV
jgi:hypothetical protein